MRKVRLFSRKGIFTLMSAMIVAGVAISCSKDDDTQPPVSDPLDQFVKADFYGTYRCEFDKWDLSAKSKLYPILEDGSYDYDNAITALEFCTKYASDYNVAEEPSTPATAEDCSFHYHTQDRYNVITISENEFMMVRRVEFTEGNGMTIYEIKGAYTYNSTTHEFSVHNVAVESDPEDIKVKVMGFSKGKSAEFALADYYWWCAASYDELNKYLPYVTTIYHTNTVVAE